MFTKKQLKCEYFPPLSADDVFCDLAPESRVALDNIKRTERRRQGVCLFSRGDLPCGIFLLREGSAQLIFDDRSGDKRRARLIEPNELFGLTEAFAGVPYETTAETLAPCLCEFIERTDFIRFLKREPIVCLRLARLLAHSLQKSYRLFSSLN